MRAPILSIALAGMFASAEAAPYYPRLVTAARRELAAVIAEKPPVLVPPVPVKIAWKPVRLGSLDLGAPLVAVTTADLDGDAKAELYAVTAREVLAIRIGKKVKIVARVAYTGDPSPQVPRDLVGTATVEGGAVVAKCSGWAAEMRVTWNKASLVGATGDASKGALVCPGERLLLVPGRNHFGDVDRPLYDVRCRADLVDWAGAPLALRAELGAKLVVTATRGTDVTTFELGEYGTAFALGDVDRDGAPEVVVTGAGAPGDPDAVKVVTLGGDEKKGLFRKVFQGGVAGVAIADGDGDGIPEVLAVVRQPGTSRVDIWRLD